MRRQRRYSDEIKRSTLVILQSNGGNLTETANQTGIPIQTIFSWREGSGIHDAVLQGMDQRRRELASFMGKVVAKALNMLPYKLEKAGVKDTALAVAILVDKMQLLQNQPTEIIAKEKMSDEQLFGRLAQLAQTIRERAALEEQKQKPLASAFPPDTMKNMPATATSDALAASGSNASLPCS
jgi:hypothetical protein